MQIRDHDGEGRWSAAQIVARYHDYTTQLGVAAPRDVWPRVFESGGCKWVSPVMERIIEGIEEQDVACAEIGVEFIEEDRGFVFGAILKSNTARALRRCQVLTGAQVDRIRRRIVRLYATGVVPREFAQYLRLIRRVGAGPYWPEVAAAEPRNYFAKRARAFFESRFDRDGRPAPNTA